MITADKVFKGNTEIIKIYKGLNLEWEQAASAVFSWDPTTLINQDNNFFLSTRNYNNSYYVKLNLPKNVAAVSNGLQYYHPISYEETCYIKEYTINTDYNSTYYTLDYNEVSDHNAFAYCKQYNNDPSITSSISFKVYNGRYSYPSGQYGNYKIYYPRIVYHPVKTEVQTYSSSGSILSTYYRTINFNNGLWSLYNHPDESTRWTNSFQIQGNGTYMFDMKMESGLEDGEYSSCDFDIYELDSDTTVKQNLHINYDTGGSTKTKTISYIVSDDNPHTIYMKGDQPNWGKVTWSLQISNIWQYIKF